MAKSRFVQGYYTPKHPDKYIGDVTKIRYMSSWELSTHTFFDTNPRILRWASEEIKIPYIKPTDRKIHHYYPDYWIEYVNKDGEVLRELIEVKPLAQTKISKSKNPKTKLYENLTYAVNQAKWEAATAWCKQHHMTFRVISEGDIFR
jgi:hypothetical protein